MSEPTTFQFAKIAVGNDADPEVFTTFCGVQTTGFNRTVQTNDRNVRDCALPGKVPERRLRVVGRSRTLTGSGLYNLDQQTLIDTLEGVRKNYQYIIWDISVSEAGEEIGTWEGPGIVTAINMGTSEDNDATIEITIQSDGVWTYTPAA